MAEAGHKIFTNTVTKKGHKKIKIKICLTVLAKFQSAMRALSSLGGLLTDIVLEYLCLIHAVNGMLLDRSAYCVRHEGYCCDLGGFDVYSSFWIEQVWYSHKICYKALLRLVPRWKLESLFEWIVWRSDFFLDCILDVLGVCDNERGVLRRVWPEICRETYLKGYQG